MSDESSSGGKIVAAAGIGLIALLGGVGRMLLRSGDDMARVASHSGDDLLRSSDDLLRGGAGAFSHADDAATGAPWNRAASGLDDASKGPGPRAFRPLNNLASPPTRVHSIPFARSLGGQPLAPLDDIAAQESHFAETLGSLADPADGTAAAARNAPAATGSAAVSSSQRNAAALAELRARVVSSRAQLADQMAELRKLQAANRPLDPQVAANAVAQQHERALHQLSRLGVEAERMSAAELARAAEDVRPAGPISQSAEAAVPTSTAARAADDPLLESLNAEGRRLALRHGAEFVKELLPIADREFRRTDDERDASLPPGYPRLLSILAANPNRPLTGDELSQLQQEIAGVLNTSDTELARLDSGPSLPADPLLFNRLSRATLLRVQLYHAGEALKRHGGQFGN